MQELQLLAAEPGGEHLVLADPQGTRYRVGVDDALRTAVRRAGAPPAQAVAAVSPRELQAVIRAGATPEEAAERTGWSVERVHLFAGPILAEREHIALRARAAAVRLRGRGGEAPTLEARVVERLGERGVDPGSARWDASRATGGQEWQVRLLFVAGGRDRHATWRYDLADQVLEARDDEARWLSEDETGAAATAAASADYLSGPGGEDESLAARRGRRRPAGSRTADADRPDEREPAPAAPAPADPGSERPDLITAMRERSKARGRRGRRKASAAAQPPAPAATPSTTVPGDELPFEDELPARPSPTDLPRTAPGDAADPAAAAVVEDALAGDVEPVEPDDLASESDDDVPLGWRELTADAPDADLPDDAPDEAPDSQEAESEPAGDPADLSGPDAGVDEAGGPDDGADPSNARDDPDHAPEPEASPRAADPEKPRGRKGRPSVPSWDDIMFGGRQS